MAILAILFTSLFPNLAEQRYASTAHATPSSRAMQFSGESAVQTARIAGDPAPMHRYRARHKGCNTHSCDVRVGHKWFVRTNKHWRAYTAPYRAWLLSTGNCETRGYSFWASYRVNTGNGFYGRYQFTYSSWHAVGGSGYPHQARPLEQDYRTVRLRKIQGTVAWPVCG